MDELMKLVINKSNKLRYLLDILDLLSKLPSISKEYYSIYLERGGTYYFKKWIENDFKMFSFDIAYMKNTTNNELNDTSNDASNNTLYFNLDYMYPINHRPYGSKVYKISNITIKEEYKNIVLLINPKWNLFRNHKRIPILLREDKEYDVIDINNDFKEPRTFYDLSNLDAMIINNCRYYLCDAVIFD